MMDDRRTQWLRGILDLCVLQALTGGERYGYDIAQSLDQAGLGKVKGGTLYPLLARLKAAGYVSVEWREGDKGPGRKYYFLTPEGRTFLTHQSAQWAAFSDLIDKLLTSKGQLK